MTPAGPTTSAPSRVPVENPGELVPYAGPWVIACLPDPAYRGTVPIGRRIARMLKALKKWNGLVVVEIRWPTPEECELLDAVAAEETAREGTG